MFGLFPVGSDEMNAAINTVQTTFGLDDGVVGLPRYENDPYCRADAGITGNWWIISSLWMAQYHLETDNTDQAFRVLDWVHSHATSTGVLPEQINPRDDTSLSVSPLTWSHAEYIATLLDTITEKK